MLAPARHGRLLTRSLRFLSSPSPLPARQFFQVQLLQKNAQQSCRPSIRAFSSFPRFQQQAEARREDPVATSDLTEFAQLAEHGLVDHKVIQNINAMNIHTMTPVQQMTINQCLDGADVVAQAKTGTGKTLAFLMPIVQRLMQDSTVLGSGGPPTIDIRALIISPTRELAEQIAVEAKKIVRGTGMVVQTAVGGTQRSYHLSQMQRRGCHILVGTPGRVNDLLSDQYSNVKLGNIDTFVLDEADRLLDIGFAPAIEEIQSYMPQREDRQRQTLMFSATIPKSVVSLVRNTMRPDFKFVRTVDPNETPLHEKVSQKIVFLPGLQNQTPAILEIATNAIEAHKRDPENNPPFKAIIFYPSVNEVTLAASWFENMREPNADGGGGGGRSMFGRHPLEPCQIVQMSSKLSQNSRTANAERFRVAESAILCSSDVTARGMDFPNVSHVIQVGLPKTAEDYIHRVGRTGRAGKSGQGWLLVNEDDRQEVDYKFGRELQLQEDTTLHTGKLDMTRGAQLPANIARIMQMTETGIKAVPFGDKAQTYSSMFAVLSQQSTGRRKQTLVDMINDLTRYGWGLSKPPGISTRFIEKMGLSRCSGLEIDDRFQRDTSRGMDNRGGYSGGFGDRRGGRDSFGGGRGGRGGGDLFGRGEDREWGSRGGGGGGFGGRQGGGFEGGRGGGRGGYGGSRSALEGSGGRGGRPDPFEGSDGW